jgi:hypothetical protein
MIKVWCNLLEIYYESLNEYIKVYDNFDCYIIL